MGRQSKLARSPEVKKKIDELAKNKALTQEQITQAANAHALDVGEEGVGKSTVNRYLMSFNEVMKKREESTLVAKQWISRMGDIPDGDYGRAMVEILRTLSFDLSIAASQKGLGEDLPGTVRMVKDLSVMIERVERAASENQKRLARINDTDATAIRLDTIKRFVAFVDEVHPERKVLLGELLEPFAKQLSHG